MPATLNRVPWLLSLKLCPCRMHHIVNMAGISQAIGIVRTNTSFNPGWHFDMMNFSNFTGHTASSFERCIGHVTPSLMRGPDMLCSRHHWEMRR
jgi:hypothetical protein